MSGYRMPHADCGRTGQVRASARAWRHFERLVVDGPGRGLLRGGAWAVLVDGEGHRVVAVYPQWLVVVEPFGARVLDGSPGWSAAMDEHGVVYGGTLHPWDGRAPRVLDDSGLFEGGVEQVAARWAGGAWSTVAMVVQPRRAKRLLARGTTEAGDWEHRFTEPGGGAIDAQGNVACTPGGTRVVRVDSHGQVSSDRPLPEGIVIEQLVAVADALVAVDVDRRRLHTLSAEGAVQSTVTVPLAMAGPTVTGPGLRRYAVGEGIAAVEDGRILWSKIANVALHVTCLGADGVLVAGGARLCHYDHEGTLRSERSTPDRSAIVAPPAPAPDGTLYLATASGVFALR